MLMYYLQTCIVGLTLLGLIYFYYRKQGGKRQAIDIIFTSMILVNAILLITELYLNLYIDSSGGPQVVMQGMTFLYYSLNPVPGALWILFIEVMLRKNVPLSRRLIAAVSIPVVINLAFSFISLFTDFTFHIDTSGGYHRGTWFLLMAACAYSYLIYSFFLLFNKRRKIPKQDFIPLVLFAVPPFLAGVVQTLFYGTSILWMAMAFSLLIIYFSILSVQIFTDHLTGLANRRKFDSHLDYLSASDYRRRHIGGIVMDIDNFKNINDIHGHETGDRVLEAVGAILKNSVRKQDLVARIGGDEFAAILEVSEYKYLREAVCRIERNIIAYNQKSKYPFPISLSIGYDLYDYESGMPIEEFIKQLDNIMYAKKKLNKRLYDSDPS